MSRVAKYPERYLLKLEAGTLERLSVHDNVAEFIREAIDEKLSGREPVNRFTMTGHPEDTGPVAVVRGDTPIVEEQIAAGQNTMKRLRDVLGWPEMRIEKALAKSGRVKFSGGIMELKE